MGIAKKLKLLINGQSVNQWARDHDLPPQTVHEWIKMDRMPRSAGLKTLIEATGMPKKWWLHDEHHPVTTVNPLTTGSGQHSRLPVQSHSIAGENPMILADIPISNEKPSPIDVEVLANVIENIEKTLDKRRKILSAQQKAALIQLIYDYCVETGKQDSVTVERFLKLVG